MKHYLVGAAFGLVAFIAHPAISEEKQASKMPVQPASVEQNLEDARQLTEYDRKAIQFVVNMHVASLSQQRADLFSKTFTEKTQNAFGSSRELMMFFSMRYIPVLLAKAFQFDRLSLEGAVPTQHGYLVDKYGKRWRLSYGLRHIAEGDWRIISTIIKLAPGDPV